MKFATKSKMTKKWECRYKYISYLHIILGMADLVNLEDTILPRISDILEMLVSMRGRCLKIGTLVNKMWLHVHKSLWFGQISNFFFFFFSFFAH